jgi:hypothetical protein
MAKNWYIFHISASKYRMDVTHFSSLMDLNLELDAYPLNHFPGSKEFIVYGEWKEVNILRGIMSKQLFGK